MKFVEEFCRKYDARVSPSAQPWRRTKPVPFSVFEEQGMAAFAQIQYQDIPMVEITMPEDRFRALMEHDHWLANAGLRCDTNFFNNYVMRVGNMIVDHERECRLRSEHSALQKAWEQYQIMLRMVDDGQN
jgi:hypothetical protein